MVSCHWQCQTSRLDEKGLESFDLLQVGSGSDSVKFCSITESIPVSQNMSNIEAVNLKSSIF